jgi:Protein of unknown function (DUF642)/PEP-CTERM motif
MFSTLSRILVTVCLCGAAHQVGAANLIVNGGFEDPPTAVGSVSIYGAGADIGGWTVLGASATNAVMTVSTSYVEPAVLFPSYSGLASLDLTASGNTLNGGVSQLVSLTVGAKYLLSFWFANTAGVSGAGGTNSFYLLPSSVRVGVSGLPDVIVNNDITALPSTSNWLESSVEFTATSANTVISFVNNTGQSDSAALLDAVSLDLVAAVPEPASWAMMLAGLGLCALVLRRGRSA